MVQPHNARAATGLLQGPISGWLLTVAICLPPLWLLLYPQREFGIDWPCHVWPTRYYGEYFRHHYWFPEVLNTDWLSGMPNPVFYGFLFYPVTGLLSVAIGADGAVRAVLALVLVLQCRQVFQLIQALAPHRPLAWAIAALTSWATYALTNLYNRSALPEFVAVALITAATCSFLRWLQAAPGEPTLSLKVESFLYYALAAGVHPLTAVFGFIFLAVVTLAGLLVHSQRGRVFATLALGGAAVGLVLSPWLFATWQFHGSLDVQKRMRHIVHFPDSIDSVWSRLSPLPYDARVPESGAAAMDRNETPFLDAQLNFGLLALAVCIGTGVVAAGRRGGAPNRLGVWLGIGAVVVFVYCFSISVFPGMWPYVPRFFNSLQFAYRLVSYQNLALLTIIAGALMAQPAWLTWGEARAGQALLAALLGLGVVGLALKLSHAAAIMHTPPADELASRQNGDYALHLPASFYGWPGYSVTGAEPDYPSTAQPVFLGAGTGANFGHVGAARITLTEAASVCIQVQPFPWNRVVVDGRELRTGEAQLASNGHVLTLAAGAHQFAYEWQPPTIWVCLSLLSFFSAGVWVLLAIALRFTAARPASPGIRVPS